MKHKTQDLVLANAFRFSHRYGYWVMPAPGKKCFVASSVVIPQQQIALISAQEAQGAGREKGFRNPCAQPSTIWPVNRPGLPPAVRHPAMCAVENQVRPRIGATVSDHNEKAVSSREMQAQFQNHFLHHCCALYHRWTLATIRRSAQQSLPPSLPHCKYIYLYVSVQVKKKKKKLQ